jgi:TolA-binding protein
LHFFRLATAAARVPQLEEDLRVVHVQCAKSQEVARALAAKAKVIEGELLRLRRLEANHLAELDSVKRVEQEKVDNLNQRLGEVDGQCRKLREEMTTQSQVLMATAKR